MGFRYGQNVAFDLDFRSRILVLVGVVVQHDVVDGPRLDEADRPPDPAGVPRGVEAVGVLQDPGQVALAGAVALRRAGDLHRELVLAPRPQRVVVDQLLPIAKADVQAGGAPETPGGGTVEYLFEPSPQEIFNQLLPRYIEVQVYRALLESNAAFYAAQMTAMDTATRNSAEMIGSLTLYMNKVRQAAITREIIEVVSGAQAL